MELKPCPFCGGEVSIALTGSGLVNWLFITRGCNRDNGKNCTCRLFMESNRYWIDRSDVEELQNNALEELAKAWNRRVNDE